MKPVSPGLLTTIAKEHFFMAELITITLVSGSTLRYTSADADLVYGGQIYSSTGPKFDRTVAKWMIGLGAGQMTMVAYADPSHLVNNVSFLTACRVGAFDGAFVTIERAIMDTFGDLSNGTVQLFDGRCGQIEADRMSAVFTLIDWRELLNQNAPYRLYQTGCTHTWSDIDCTLSKAAFTDNVQAVGAPTPSKVQLVSARPVGWYDLGVMRFTTGANANIQRTVKHWDGSSATLTYPFPFAPAVGDAIAISPGCDKLVTTCDTKFNNKQNFGGTPFVPVAETAI